MGQVGADLWDQPKRDFRPFTWVEMNLAEYALEVFKAMLRVTRS